MEHDSNSILSVQVVDKREVQGKSTNMEKLGAELGLRHVLDAGVEIAQFVTDAHVQIGALMSKHKIYFKWILNDCSFYYTYFFFHFRKPVWVYLPSHLCLLMGVRSSADATSYGTQFGYQSCEIFMQALQYSRKHHNMMIKELVCLSQIV